MEKSASEYRWVLPGLIIPMVALALLASVFIFRAEPETEPDLSRLGYISLLDPQIIDPFELLDQSGQPVDETLFDGRWTLVFFGFTHCPDICPTTLSVLSTLFDEFDHPLLQVVFVTVDPERDSVDHLGGYVGAFNPAFVALTGELPEIERFAHMLQVVFRKQPVDSGYPDDYQVDHSINIALVDAQAVHVGSFRIPHRVPEMHRVLSRIMPPP